MTDHNASIYSATANAVSQISAQIREAHGQAEHDRALKIIDEWGTGLQLGSGRALDQRRDGAPTERHYFFFYDPWKPENDQMHHDCFVLSMRPGAIHVFAVRMGGWNKDIQDVFRDLRRFDQDKIRASGDKDNLWDLDGFARYRSNSIGFPLNSAIQASLLSLTRRRLSPNSEIERFNDEGESQRHILHPALFEDLYAALRIFVLKIDPAHGDLFLESDYPEIYNWAHRTDAEEIKERRLNAARIWGTGARCLIELREER